jgi:hypothetical protein
VRLAKRGLLVVHLWSKCLAEDVNNGTQIGACRAGRRLG